MRVFTTEEERLLTRIRDGHGTNLYSLIDPWISGVSFQVDTTLNAVDFIFEKQDFNFERLKYIQTIVIQAVNLIKLLEDKGYILMFINANQLPPNPFTFGQAAINLPTVPYHFPDPRISKMFCEYSIQEIFVTPELNKFVSDGFKTREEGRANRQWYTTMLALVVAIIALFVNIFKSSGNKEETGLNSIQNSLHLNKTKSDTTIITETTIKTSIFVINSKTDTIKR